MENMPFSYRNTKTTFIDIVYFSISFQIVVNNNGVLTALTNNPAKGVLQCFSKTAMNISNMRTLAETLDATLRFASLRVSCSKRQRSHILDISVYLLEKERTKPQLQFPTEYERQ